MELSVTLDLQLPQGWLTIPVKVAGLYVIDMVLDTGSPVSTISDRTRQRLIEMRLLDDRGGNRYFLRELTIEEQRIPDLRMRLGRRATQVGAQGILGLDFLVQFTDVHFHVPTRRLTLSRPNDAS